MEKRILAVIVTYNRKDLLHETIEALLSQDVSCDILVVDNNSTDGTCAFLDKISSENDRIIVNHLPKNIGGAGGFNHGMRWGAEHNYEYIWIMDDDCIVHHDTLTNLIEADQLLGGPENYGFLSSCVLWTDGHECVMNRQKVAKNFYHHVELMKHGVIAITQATFVSLFIPRGTILDFGLPIKEYFIWGDDIEYTQRIALRGKKDSFLVGKSIVTHKMKSNVGSNISIDNIERIDRYRLAFRNESCTYRRQGFLGVCIYCARILRSFKNILLHAKSHRCKRFLTLFRGFFQGLVFFPKVEYVKESSSNTTGD